MKRDRPSTIDLQTLGRLAVCATLAFVGVGAGSGAVLSDDSSPAFRAAVADFIAGRYKECQLGFKNAALGASRPGLAARADYGAACCAAQRDDIDGGFEALGLALANGYVDLDRAMTDPRLEVLRADPRWVRFVAATSENQQSLQKSLDPDLQRLFLESEDDRATLSGGAAPPSAAVVERGVARRRDVLSLVDRGRVKKALDAFHASAILAESDRAEELARASELARQAVELDPDLLAARPLLATAIDREQMVAGKPQRFGTQIVLVDGTWQLYTVDPAISDADRDQFGLPPLAEARARAAELNRPPISPGAPAAPPHEHN
ncbi:MAG: hypothetical protein ABI639_03260 [Thermoanaerobaculia bacterium]